MKWEGEIQSHHRKGILELASAFVSQFPDKPAGWVRLGQAYLSIGNAGDGLKTLTEACERFPEEATLHRIRALCALVTENLEEALSAVERSLALAPGDPDALDLRFKILVQLRDYEKAEACIADISDSHETILTRIYLMTHFAKKRDEWHPLLCFCDDVLKKYPGNTAARYYRAIALIQLDRGEDAAATLNPASFLSLTRLDPPSGKTLAEFTSALKQEILLNPTLIIDSRTKATRHGQHTQQLLQPDDTAIPSLLETIHRAVDRYAEKMDALESTDGFITHRPKQVKITSWAVINPGESWQAPHIHTDGWLSGVYYVAAPRGGHLLLGAIEIKDRTPWKVERIQPEAGLLVMFPSFIPHGTEPTHSDELRICVAFDVIPA